MRTLRDAMVKAGVVTLNEAFRSLIDEREATVAASLRAQLCEPVRGEVAAWERDGGPLIPTVILTEWVRETHLGQLREWSLWLAAARSVAEASA